MCTGFLTVSDTDLIEACYARSLDLLRSNCSAAGILACAPGARARARNYTNIFGRDAAICALGMAASREPDLLEGAHRGLATLAAAQARNGQIPNYVTPETGVADFWYLGCIDATLWWLIALRHLAIQGLGPTPGKCLDQAVGRALSWLSCQEHQSFFLLQQNEASDWADIMPRSGFVLYTNALWHWVKRLYGLADADLTKHYCNLLLMPSGDVENGHHRARLLSRDFLDAGGRADTYLSFMNFSYWGEEVDTLGNLLALLAGLPPDRRVGDRVLATLRALNIDQPYPARAVAHPLERDNSLWRPYMERHHQNLPQQYHNGGVWPLIGGFWVIALAQRGLYEEAWAALARLAELNRRNDWEFNEWFHGTSGAASGMPRQSWNAAMFVLALGALRQREAGIWRTLPDEGVAAMRN